MRKEVNKEKTKQTGRRGDYVLSDRIFREYLVQIKGFDTGLHKLHKIE